MTTATGRTLVQELGAFVADLRLEQVPDHVVDKAQACLLHGLVVGLAGVRAEFPRIAWACVPETVPGHGARLFVDGRWTGRASAAFANGVLLHSRVQEDTHGTTHAGTTVIPAALATAESVGADGKRVLEAVIAGYEVTAALAREYTAKTTPRGFRASAIYGPFGAAAASAKVLGLDARACAHALAFVSAFAGGTTESFIAGSMEWHFENGVASQNGVLAAEIARSGGAGALSALEGQAGFLRAMAGTTEGLERVTTGLGRQWELMNVTFKLYPVCAFNQSPVTAMLQLLEHHDIQPDDIELIDVEMNEYEVNYPGMAYHGPYQSVGQTQMSTAFCLGLAAARRQVTYDGLLAFHDPRVLEGASKVRMHGNPARSPMTARIQVRTKDGRLLEHGLEQRAEEFYAWGFDRARELARRLAPETPFSAAQIEAIGEAVARLREARPVSELVDRLTNGTS